MNLRYHLEKTEKIYTLKTKVNNKETQEAHYKFIKLHDVKETD